VADVLYLLILVAFFALMVAFVFVCERVVGKEDVAGSDGTPLESDDHVLEEVPA